MGSSFLTTTQEVLTHSMKFQLLLVAALAVAAFAAPVPEYIDPDCIEDEQIAEEPAPEIEAEFALGVPDLVWNGNDNAVAADEECEDPIETTVAPTTAAEECVDETLAPTVAPTEPACEDDPIPTTPADECAEDNGVENAPILHDIVVEPAMVESNPIIISEEHMIADIEECEEY